MGDNAKNRSTSVDRIDTEDLTGGEDFEWLIKHQVLRLRLGDRSCSFGVEVTFRPLRPLI